MNFGFDVIFTQDQISTEKSLKLKKKIKQSGIDL